MERLVESIPNKGTRAAPVSIEDVQDVYATRVLLRSRRCAGHGRDSTPPPSARSEPPCDSMVERVRCNDRQAYDLHRQVHFALYERCGSPWLLHMIEIVWSHTEAIDAWRRRSVGSSTMGLTSTAWSWTRSRTAISRAIDALRRLERTANLMVEAYESET